MRSLLSLLRLPLFWYWTARARIQFFVRRVRWPINFEVRGNLGLSSLGNIELGSNVTIISDSKHNRAGINHPTQLVAGAGATLKIGDHVGISGASIYCTEAITIGNHVLIGANSKIYDTDFHPIDYLARRANEKPATAPVAIEDDVWLCANVTVLKGVTIGKRAIIAAGSVVTSDIPADHLAGGVPAKVIRRLNQSDT